MKSKPIKLVEDNRIRHGRMGSPTEFGNNGAFSIPGIPPHCRRLNCICSDQEGWDHVSVSLNPDATECPTWDEMIYIRSLFFTDDEWPIQYGPGKRANINTHPGCLHWWRPQNEEVPRPSEWMV